jgi:large subunit ribosomal protein L6
MSRIGKKAVVIPAGVKVEVGGGTLTVTGKRGTLSRPIPRQVGVEVSGSSASVSLIDGEAGNIHGMYRTLLSNMVQGVGEGFTRFLEIVGVGYKAEVKSGALQLALGYSHPVVFALPQGITAEVEANTIIKLTGMDKELLGETAARIRMLRKPDAYKNKGIRYRGERLVKKVGKAAGK